MGNTLCNNRGKGAINNTRRMPVRTRSASRAPTINETSSSEDEVVLRRRGSSSSLLSPSNSDSENERGTPSKQKRTRAKKFTRSISSVSTSEKNKKTPTNNDTFDVEAYLEKRVMTSAQEYFNAITMVPGMVCALYIILSGCWMASHHRHYQEDDGEGKEDSGWVTEMASEIFGFGNEHGLFQSMGCINSSTFPAVTALPPLALVAGALGNLVHSPVSIYYHWKCATTIEPSQRIIHWARRADNASIHFASICASYATSGRMDYCLLNLIFNVDCMFKQLGKEVHPRRNQMRLGCSILMYLLPVLVNGHYALFGQFILMFGLGGYLFGAYPVGGWSHGLFHIVLSFLPYLVFQAAIPLPSSQEQIKLAVNCAGMAVGQP